MPVGEDQRQHLELANDIAQKFNHDYGVDFFPHIEPLILGPAARVMSLRDGTKKMSKSDPSDQSRINLNDDPDTIALKIRRAKTDPEPLPGEPAGLENRPEARNLVGIYAALADTDYAGVLREHGGKGFGAFKEALTDSLVAKLPPIAAETDRLLADPAEIDCGAARRRAPGWRDRRSDRGRGGASGGISSALIPLQPATAAPIASPIARCSTRSATRSNRVGSRFTITSRAPFSFASTGNPAAGYTTSDEPSTRNTSAASVSCSARRIASAGMGWPNEMLADFIYPSHASHRGARPVRSNSTNIRSISHAPPQDRQRAYVVLPCSSTTCSSGTPEAW